MKSNTVRIIAHTFVAPNGDVSIVSSDTKATSRARAEQYVDRDLARWDDPATEEAIYFLDPALQQQRIEERRDGLHGWYVGDSGGSSLMKAYTGRTGGTRVLMTEGGQHSFMHAK